MHRLRQCINHTILPRHRHDSPPRLRYHTTLSRRRDDTILFHCRHRTTAPSSYHTAAPSSLHYTVSPPKKTPRHIAAHTPSYHTVSPPRPSHTVPLLTRHTFAPSPPFPLEAAPHYPHLPFHCLFTTLSVSVRSQQHRCTTLSTSPTSQRTPPFPQPILPLMFKDSSAPSSTSGASSSILTHHKMEHSSSRVPEKVLKELNLSSDRRKPGRTRSRSAQHKALQDCDGVGDVEGYYVAMEEQRPPHEPPRLPHRPVMELKTPGTYAEATRPE